MKRPICVLTYGRVGADSISSIPHSRGQCVRWDALEHGLSVSGQANIRNVARSKGLDIRLVPSVRPYTSDTPSTKGMYAARDAVLQHARSIDSKYILCWLDSDLAFYRLEGGDSDTTEYGQDTWFDDVCRFASEHPDVDIATGDVNGDPPIPASSTLLSNLVDLEAYYLGGAKASSNSRWRDADYYYDLSDSRSRPELGKSFVMLQNGRFAFDPELVVDRLLWSGTLARPVVFNKALGTASDRPPWVRGGVTVVLNHQAMLQGYPHLEFDGWSLRRGDSFWALKNLKSGLSVEHFPYPLLHDRKRFLGVLGNATDLYKSFIQKSMEDYLGAAALKGASRLLGLSDTLSSSSHAAGSQVLYRELTRRKTKLLALMNECLTIMRRLEGRLPMNLDLVQESVRGFKAELERVQPQDAAKVLTQQIAVYLKLEVADG